jgi:predicted GIY-YIG superfamily endonuclease
MESWSVYIVRCADGSLYTGIAKDVARRVDEHNANNLLAANYTRARRPVMLVHQEAVTTRSAAGKREYEIKCLSRAEKEALVKAEVRDETEKTSVNTNYVLIDYENVQVKSLALLKGEHFRVQVFLGPKNLKLHRELVFAMQEFGGRGRYIVLEAGGSNALDFHIAYYFGALAAADPAGFFHIISKDTGFDPLVQHLKERGVSCARSASIEAMPCFKPIAGAKVKPPAAYSSVEDMIALMLENLIRRKTGRPSTSKTLRSTIHARCGKERPEADIDAVYDALVERGYVTVDGSKVTYSLPTAA